ncbi:MAG TPA: lysophospholipid acyltransferase family protein [Gammaproteobacteria bacterium]|jgi:1-acyl-sn-glycerol-3-phosphate acyltransferase
MLAKLDRLWRAIGTGFCFLVYGLFSLLFSLSVLPILILWPGDAAARERRIRILVSWSFSTLLGGVALLGLGRVRVEGREYLAEARGKLVVATHPMYLDVVALLMLMPFADCVVKSAMLKNPYYRRFVRAAGYISNGDSAQALDACVASLKRGRSLVLFPEGTRTTTGQPPKFRRGAAQVALRAGCQVLPVMIACTPPALTKSRAWWQAPERPWQLLIRFYPPQDLSAFGYREGMPHGVSARRVTQAMQDFFTQQLSNHHEPTDRRTEAAHHRLARS